MGILWPHSNTVIRTNADARAAGAKIYFLEAGTTTPRTSYQDAGLATPHPHPVIADAYGRAPAIFLDYGDYRERVRTSGDTTLWDTDNIPNAAPATPDDEVDVNSVFQTGDIIFCLANETRDGFVRGNGRTIGSATSGASERANLDCEALFTYIWTKSTTLRAGVSGGAGANAAADWAANKTIPLPNARSAGLIGFDDMGNSAAGLVASAPVVSGSGILSGSILGANTHTLLTAEIATHSHVLSGLATVSSSGAHTHTATTSSDGAHTHTVNVTDNGHIHNLTYSVFNNIAAGGSQVVVATIDDDAHAVAFATQSHTTGITAATVSNGAHTHTLTTSSDGAHAHALSGNTDNSGGGGAHNNLQRSCP